MVPGFMWHITCLYVSLIRPLCGTHRYQSHSRGREVGTPNPVPFGRAFAAQPSGVCGLPRPPVAYPSGGGLLDPFALPYGLPGSQRPGTRKLSHDGWAHAGRISHGPMQVRQDQDGARSPSLRVDGRVLVQRLTRDAELTGKRGPLLTGCHTRPQFDDAFGCQ